MNVAAISSTTPVTTAAELPKAAPAPSPVATSPTATDTVTLSRAAAHPTTGDVDHDGDSH
ncbi:hypothetical protein [Granulicella paludicola]|uniref:hypothetical protein n=1 Tax=Granulicella paludicola TaxID=474951 RepID=UPI0021DFC8A3|nr:hypothetical protein [Granulicella paludicola]